MKILILTLSLGCLHATTFSAQEAFFPISPLRKPVITPEYIERDARHRVCRMETETIIVFSVSLKREFCLNIFASIEKATGVKRVLSRKTLFSRDQSPDTETFYDEYPEETYNALQALYEKQQQEERKQNS